MKAQEAQRLFDELNKRYWHGRLPRYRVIRRAVFPGRFTGWCNNKSRTIFLLRALDGERLRLTLLHEMCHIGTEAEEFHGPRFLRRLRRLMRLGEPKLLEHIELYDGTADEKCIATKQAGETLIREITFDEAVRDDLEACVLASGSPPRWPKVRRWLAEQYRLVPSQFDRLAPWAEREWRRLSREQRQDERTQKAFTERKMAHQVKDYCKAATGNLPGQGAQGEGGGVGGLDLLRQ